MTNGKSAAAGLRAAGIEGSILSWDDVLHEGPVPAGLDAVALGKVRARFIADQGWGEYDDVLDDFSRRDEALAAASQHDDVVLWFEHDLYDQIQLIQVLDRLASEGARRTRLALVQAADYLGTLDADRMRELFAARRPLTAAQRGLAVRAWAAFRAADPRALVQLVRRDHGSLPFLRAGLVRHLQQYPWVATGLSRSEAQILETLAAGPRTLGDTFHAAHHEREESVFLGDSVFAAYVAGLARGPEPLLLFDDDRPVRPPRAAERNGFWSRRAALTDVGHAVVAGKRDAVRTRGIDRWLGGVHLRGRDVRWRWDEEAGTLVDG